MKISPEAAGYLLEQRTQLQTTLADAYLASCRKDAELIAGAIKTAPAIAIDLGGGLGGVSACLSKFWPDCEFVIVDRDGREGRKINYGQDFGKYNQLEETGKFLRSGGVKHRLVNIDVQPPPARVDLIFSVMSWGFHYPIETHLDWTAAAAKQVVVDCRAGTGAEEALRKRFLPMGFDVKLFSESPKHEWYLCSQ
jgi:hypothetical protein